MSELYISDSASASDSESKKDEIIEKYLWKMLEELKENTNEYYDYHKIKNDLVKSINDNLNGFVNRCVDCGIDIGPSNPRQLCGKWRCDNKLINL